MRDKLIYALLIVGALFFFFNLHGIFDVLPDEANQGAIYRIMYLHVPAGITCLIGFFIGMIFSIGYLTTGKMAFDAASASINEVALVFAFMNVVTGSIWARIIWGIWWTWDPRLTAMFVCLLIYVGYLLLRQAIDEPTRRGRLSAAFSIFGTVDVIVVWKSIEWFRTQHPGPVLDVRTGGGHIDPAMQAMIFRDLGAFLLIAAALVLLRMKQEENAREIDALRRLAHA
ncbi:MAG TPA: cytochrome c biogenesis protein CcsA [Bryobacteraceae bacterium]|jgi:heme exporter protein C